jgi:hypothetical protein
VNYRSINTNKAIKMLEPRATIPKVVGDTKNLSLMRSVEHCLSGIAEFPPVHNNNNNIKAFFSNASGKAGT